MNKNTRLNRKLEKLGETRYTKMTKGTGDAQRNLVAANPSQGLPTDFKLREKNPHNKRTKPWRGGRQSGNNNLD